MASLYLSQERGRRRFTIAPLSKARQERCVNGPPDTRGYFLTEESLDDPIGEVRILARMEDDDAAYDLARLVNLL